jgi:hypothetical protein
LAFGGAVGILPSDSSAELVYKFLMAVASADFGVQSFSLRDLSNTIHARGGSGKLNIVLKGFDGAQLLDNIKIEEAQAIQATARQHAENLTVVWRKLYVFWLQWCKLSRNHLPFIIAAQDVGTILEAFHEAQCLASRGLHSSAESAGGGHQVHSTCFTEGTHKYSHGGREYSYTVEGAHGRAHGHCSGAESRPERPCMFYLASVDSFQRHRDTAEWWSSVFVIVSPCLGNGGDETWVHDLALYLFTPEQKKRGGISEVVFVGVSLGANFGLTCMTSSAFAECMTASLFVGAYLNTSEPDQYEAFTSAFRGNDITLVASPSDECVPWVLAGEFFRQCGDVGLNVVYADFCHEDICNLLGLDQEEDRPAETTTQVREIWDRIIKIATRAGG